MHLAIKAKKYNCVDYLLKNGANIYYFEGAKVDNSPIFYAIKQRDIKTIELICKKKLNYNMDQMKTSQNYSPLQLAFLEK